jgi:hypothetical protein
MGKERFPTRGSVPSLLSVPRRGANRQHVSILGDLAGSSPPACRRSAWRGPALFAAGFVVVVAGTLWAGHRSALGPPHAGVPTPGASAAPRAAALARTTQRSEPVDHVGSGGDTWTTAPGKTPVAPAAPSAAVIVDVAPAPPGSAPAPADAGATANSTTATARTPARTASSARVAGRAPTPARHKPGSAAPLDEPDVDIIAAIVKRAGAAR